MKPVSTIVATTAAPEEVAPPIDERKNPQDFAIRLGG